MSTKDFLRRGLGLAVPLFGALYLAACGGSASFRGADGGGSSIGGGSSTGGSSSGGSSIAGAPNPSGGNSYGGGGGQNCNNVACPAIACGPGSISVQSGCCSTCIPGGGAGGCGIVACPLIACGSGSTLVTEPGQCCPTCIPSGEGGAAGSGVAGGGGNAGSAGTVGSAGSGGVNQCGGVLCPEAIACAKGYVMVKQAGACCPTCVADAQACTAGEQGYQTLRASLLEQSGATSCNVNTDCTYLSGVPQCGDQCVTSVVNASLEPDMANQLSLWASSYCGTCMPVYPPCAAPPLPFCSAGQCQLYHAL
jgi:hypothetical protein